MYQNETFFHDETVLYIKTFEISEYFLEISGIDIAILIASNCSLKVPSKL
jgi:hypothetical protein